MWILSFYSVEDRNNLIFGIITYLLFTIFKCRAPPLNNIASRSHEFTVRRFNKSHQELINDGKTKRNIQVLEFPSLPFFNLGSSSQTKIRHSNTEMEVCGIRLSTFVQNCRIKHPAFYMISLLEKCLNTEI